MRLRHLLIAVLGALALTVGTAAADGGLILPISQVQAGMNCIGETVVHGTTISSFNVHVIDIVQDPVEGPRILVSVSGPAVDATGHESLVAPYLAPRSTAVDDRDVKTVPAAGAR